MQKAIIIGLTLALLLKILYFCLEKQALTIVKSFSDGKR